MHQRLDYKLASPDALEAMLHVQKHVDESSLEESLLELVKSRASQINGCGWCLDMHTKDARARGEKALVDLTLAIIAINGWNRLNVAFRTKVGDYVSPHAKARR